LSDDKEHPDWETLLPFNRLERIRVPSGWIYRTVHGTAVALCFVPEPQPVVPIVKVKEAPPTP